MDPPKIRQEKVYRYRNEDWKKVTFRAHEAVLVRLLQDFSIFTIDNGDGTFESILKQTEWERDDATHTNA